jgi:hypothetical protein
VAVVGAQALSVGGEPGADDLVLGGGEENVSIFGVSARLRSASLSLFLHPMVPRAAAYLIWVRDRSYTALAGAN